MRSFQRFGLTLYIQDIFITELKPLFNRSNSFVISNSGGNSVVSAAAKLVFNDADEFVGGHQAPLPPPLPPKTERPPLPPKQRIR